MNWKAYDEEMEKQAGLLNAAEQELAEAGMKAGGKLPWGKTWGGVDRTKVKRAIGGFGTPRIDLPKMGWGDYKGRTATMKAWE